MVMGTHLLKYTKGCWHRFLLEKLIPSIYGHGNYFLNSKGALNFLVGTRILLENVILSLMVMGTT